MGEKEKCMLSVNQLTTVLDYAPVAVLVSGLDDYELIYRNKLAEKFLSNEPGKSGMKCYEAAGRYTSCPLCENGGSDENETMVHQFQVDNRIYQCSGKIIHWEDRPAHIEYILDVTEEQKEKERARVFKEELSKMNEKLQFVINTIPGGIAIYKISDVFETLYFSDGVPELTGYTVEEYRESIRQDIFRLVYPEDIEKLVGKAREAIMTHKMVNLEFRKKHKDGHIVWVRAQAIWIGEEDGIPLLYSIFHNVSDLKEAQLEMKHLINSIPGGIASYRIEGERFIPTYFSDGVAELSGHTRAEMEEMARYDALSAIYEADRARVIEKAKTALERGEPMDISYRMRHKNGNLVWIHMNGQRIGPLSDSIKFYAVFTGMTAESRLFESIADETADGIYVIDKETYELLYVNEPFELFGRESDFSGLKCYEALHGKRGPCSFCPLDRYGADGKEHLLDVKIDGRFFSVRFKEIDWNGIPSYVNYLCDVTDDIRIKREKERLEEYFRTVVRYLPGGIAVMRYDKESGKLIPEFLSEGFVAMTGRSQNEMLQIYQKEVTGGIYPDDKAWVQDVIKKYIRTGQGDCDFVYRMMRSDGTHFWVKNTLSVIHRDGGEKTIYAGYIDITKEQEEKEQLLSQYNEMLMQHYRESGPNMLVAGHCNITQNRMMEVIDYTDSDLLHTYGLERTGFFCGLAGLVVDDNEKRQFGEVYFNEPSIEAYRHGATELSGDYFIRLPREDHGRYARFVVKLVETPDTGDIIGVLSVTDITEETISKRILNQLTFSNYETVVKIDLLNNHYEVIAGKIAGNELLEISGKQGCYSACVEYMLKNHVIIKNRDQTAEMMSPEYMIGRLNTTGAYTFSYGIHQDGNILAKSMIVSPVDFRLKRICLAITDVTDILAAERQSQMKLEKALALAGEANLAKSDFLSSMSHDIRTPMNAIMGMTTVALAQIDNQDKVQDCLKKIELSSRHLLSLINDILDMSKIERSQISLNRTEISLPELVSQVSAIIQPRSKDAGNHLNIRAEGISHPYFYGDALRLTQILINILGNAVKFTPEGGVIELLVKEIPPVQGPAHVRFLFTVSDTGMGMQEEFLNRIFEPFTRNRGTDHVEGTGLGLSITKRLVDLMDGVITVSSCLNQGSCFKVELEFEVSSGEQKREEDVLRGGMLCETAMEGRKFMVVEDNALNSEILCELLRMCGAHTEVRVDGIQAVQAFADNPPGTYDAILMDIQMPRMNGYEASRAIRAMEREDAAVIPIIAMTANAFTEDILASKEAGMNAHVAKPIDMRLLWDVLTQMLGIKR